MFYTSQYVSLEKAPFPHPCVPLPPQPLPQVVYRRTFIKGRAGAGDFPQLLSKENIRKIEPKEIPSCLIPCLLVVLVVEYPSIDLIFRYCYNQLQKYLRHGTVFWLKWPVHDLVLETPLHPLSKLLAIQDHAQNLEEQL